MNHPTDGTESPIEFEDELSKRIHSDLQSKDTEGRYASIFQQLTHQMLESDVNTAPPGHCFTVDRIVAMEVYSASDKGRIRKLLLNMARRMHKKDTPSYLSLVANIDSAMAKIATGKNSRSYHIIDGLIVPAEPDLLESYTIKIESIGPSLIRIYFWLTPSASLHNQISQIAQKQTNTRVRLSLSWLQKIRRINNPSILARKGNNLKRALIKELDDKLRKQIHSVVTLDAPGILAGNYSGTPILVVYSCRAATESIESITPESNEHRSEFFRLVASAGADSYEVYQNPVTNDVFIEQKRRADNELRVFGKYIVFSDNVPIMLMQILWINTLKEILEFQSSQLDDLQNQIVMRSIQKTRASLASQRLQLYQHASVYEALTSTHDQERETDQRDAEPPGTGLIWEPCEGRTFEYYKHGLKSIQWLREQIDAQIPRLKESYVIAKDEFSDHTILRLQQWAICLAIGVPIFQIILQRVLDINFPVSPPVPTKSQIKKIGEATPPSSSRDSSSKTKEQRHSSSVKKKL